jgi:acyl transferase domain-containing protein
MSEQSQDAARRALLQNALTTVDRLQSKLDAMERSRREPIAIVGLGCRFPGGETPDAYWQLLENGVDAVREVPADRWTPEAYADVDPVAAAEMPTQRGGFLPRLDLFDPLFFGITPREAIWMDPQQRMVLEVCWEALEDAGVAPSSLRGSQTGVFVGITAGDYGYHAMQAGRSRMGVHIVSGITPNAAAGRVAYLLGLHGPCMAIDTACSSSLTAIHIACQSLRTGESQMALAGGVHALVRHEHFVTFHKWGMIAPDGHCKTFDASADGFVRGEGCGFLVLKRLRDALADGDRIHAVIRGSSINQDGASGGLTVPNGVAQQAVIRQALSAAAVTAADVDYIETHGTGTALGDPIELEALDAAMGEGRSADRPLVVGSVKTNIGHLEAASGVASVIKVVLSLEHQRIPPHLHFKSLTPKATLRKLALTVPTEVQDWSPSDRRRIAGVSGFGFSGTNVHLVIEEAPAPAAVTAASKVDRPAHVVTLSAKNEEALRQLASRWHAHVAAQADVEPADAGFTTNVGRSHFPFRAALVASSREQLSEQLAAVAQGQPVEHAFLGAPQDRGREKIAFLFTGQGSQYARMGRAYYDSQPTFRQALDECDRLLRPHMDRPLLTVLFEEGAALDQTIYTQPALFALEYALAELWRSWGVKPEFVLGHSVGEYVAACVAGVLSLEDALRLIAARARLMWALPGGGAMTAVLAPEDRVRGRLAPYSRNVSIAAVNAPDSVVISGDGGAVRALAAELQQDGIVCRPLAVSHAFHSPLMEPMLDEFEQVARSVRFAPPQLGLVSNLTGAVVEDDEIGPQYWRRHVREAVRFAAGMKALQEQGCSIFIEIGPTPTLLALGRRCVTEGGMLWLPSLRRDQEWRELLSSVARLYARGIDLDWRGFDGPYSRRKVALPTYPFQRQRYWIEAEAETNDGLATSAAHPLLGSRTDTATGDVLYQADLALDSTAFVADHVIAGTVLLPT